MDEFKLSYTASEINRKLGKVDTLVSTVNGVTPDAYGNVNVAADNAIIDVIELPTENINTGAFYRMSTAYLVYNQYDERKHNRHCVCVNGLPDIGNPVTTDMLNLLVYYNIVDREVYGYITAELGVVAGIPAGWYTLATLAPAFEVDWKGIITDIHDDPCDDAFRLLVFKDYYIYQDGWCKLPFACERAPAFDIQWDGEIGDKFALDMSLLGYADTYFVKVSDRAFTTEELVGATYTQWSGYEHNIDESSFDTTSYPGAIAVDVGVVIVHTADDLNAALGVPAGYITNGTYFVLVTTDTNYTNRLVAPAKITKIDEKFLPEMSVDSLGLHYVATSGDYYDLYNRPPVYTDVVRYDTSQALDSSSKQRARNNIDVYSKSEVDSKIANAGGSAPDLSAYAKKTEVSTMIANAIGAAIGGSY